MDNYNLDQDKDKNQELYGVSTQTFVRQYKTQSQMNPNSINGIDISGWAVQMIEDIKEHGL